MVATMYFRSAIAVLLIAGGVGVEAQRGPAFEAASVKRRDPGGPTVQILMIVTPGRIHFRAVTLKDCLRWAYGLADYQIMGGPAWIDRAPRWDIDARADGAATDAQITLGAKR